MTFLQVNQSVTLQTHVFALLRSFIYKVSGYCCFVVVVFWSFFSYAFHKKNFSPFQYRDALFKGSAEYCGILCYEVSHAVDPYHVYMYI